MILVWVFILIMVPGRYLQTSTKRLGNNGFGPYDVEWLRFEECRGPKAQDAASVSLKLIKTPEKKFSLEINMTLFNSCAMEEMRIDIYKELDGSKAPMWSYRVKNLCKHFAFGPIITRIGKTDKSCLFKKGHFSIAVSLTEYSHLFFGTRFFYGKYLIKTVVLSTKGNVLCISQVVSFTKKANN